MKKPVLLDRFGNPVRPEALVQASRVPRINGHANATFGFAMEGITPVTLAAVLRAADLGDPLRYLELAELIEERDLHYLAVLATRKRSVSQIDITVEAASESAEDVDKADLIRSWLRRDELQEEVFDILDCIGKGYSFTAIDWDRSSGQFWPKQLIRRDPRDFRFAPQNLTTPMEISASGLLQPLEPFRYIYALLPAKSGLPLRSGLARVAAWAWMFKAYTQRDWAIFTQTYGQPLRVGKYRDGATEEDKETLYQAVANIAGDCAGIIPESMVIEFVESSSKGATAELYRQRADWLDQQISKAVLGQTATTDAIAGGHAVGQEHRQVQQDIERADARALAAILNRDLIRPWMDLEYGPQKSYPRLVIARPEREDLVTLSNALGILVPLGLRIDQAEVRDRFGLAEPGPNAEILRPMAQNAPAAPPSGEALERNQNTKQVLAFFKRGQGDLGATPAAQAEAAPAGENSGGDPVALQTARLAAEAAPAMAAMIGQIEAMLAAAGSLDEFREMLLAGFDGAESGGLAEVLATAMIASSAAGRLAVEEDAL